jgi:hypothetical protein
MNSRGTEPPSTSAGRLLRSETFDPLGDIRLTVFDRLTVRRYAVLAWMRQPSGAHTTWWAERAECASGVRLGAGPPTDRT